MNFQAEHLDELPPEIRKQFDLLEKRLWRIDTAIAVSGSLVGFFASYLLLFISDRFWDTPAWLRALLTLAGIGTIVYFTWFWLRHWVFQRRNIRTMAKIVQKHYRVLGDKLLGIVELANEKDKPINVSKSLIRAAIKQVASEALKYDFRTAVAVKKPKIYCILSLILLVIVLIPFLLTPEAGANTLARWVLPISNVQRFTFIDIKGLPDKLVVPHGEPFDIECGIKKYRLPLSLTPICQFPNQPRIKGIVQNDKVIFKIGGVVQKETLKIKIGDASKDLEIEPMFRPQLKTMTLDVSYPEYLNYPQAQLNVQGNRAGVVYGSRVKVSAAFTRDVESVRFLNNDLVIKNTNGSSVYLGEFEITNDTKLSFNCIDRVGLSAKSPFVIEILSVKDAPPFVELPDMPVQMAVLEDELVNIKIFARDDFGIKQIGVALECQLPQSDESKRLRYVNAITNGDYTEKTLEGIYQFSPAIYQLPAGSFVNLKGTATDYYPDRGASESRLHRIYVLSKEEHARYVLEQFERIRNSIEELTRQQENLTGETKETLSLPPEKLMSGETTKQIGEQASSEKNYQKQLERLAQETTKVLKEAMRNSALPENLLKDWANNAAEMQQIANENMQPASDSLNSAQQSQNQSSRSDQLQEANKKEMEALQALQELQQKMAKHLDKLQLKGLALRFRKIAEMERNVGEVLKTNMPSIIGLKPNQLDQDKLRMLALLSNEEDLASRESSKLQGEVERFYQRTGDEDYKVVSEEMKSKQTVDEILRLADNIRNNVVAQSLQNAYRWSEQFETWAKRLEGQLQDNEGDSQNGEQQKMNELDLEQLMALLRIRDEQEALIDWTSLLEKKKADVNNYNRQAARLAYRQTDLREGLESLMSARIVAKVRPRLEQASDAMADAELMLRKPDTGKVVVEAQTDALNLLDDAIKRILNSGQAKSRGANTVAQMMNMGAANSPGGNVSGNPTKGSGKSDGKEPTGGQTSEKAVEKTSGVKSRILPSEFKEALQDYFNAIEKVNQ
ncbi:MAG TPA: hypothetical protein PLW02_00120 [Verrucomicrobiota bacterium]|nr:hypothetical protein [Verrucomicrobiota bacterium]